MKQFLTFYILVPFLAASQVPTTPCVSASYTVSVRQNFFNFPGDTFREDVQVYFVKNGKYYECLTFNKTYNKIMVFDSSKIEKVYHLNDSSYYTQEKINFPKYIYGLDDAFILAGERKPTKTSVTGDIQTLVFVDPFKEKALKRGVATEVYELDYDTKRKYYKRIYHSMQKAADLALNKAGAVQSREWIFSNFRKNNLTLNSYRHLRDSIVGNIYVLKHRFGWRYATPIRKLVAGDSIPSFRARDIYSGQVYSKEKINTTTILFFTFAGCITCKKTSQNLDKVIEKYGNRVQVIAFDPINNDPKALKDLLRTESKLYPYCIIEHSWTENNSIYEFPTIVIVNSHGVILRKEYYFEEQMLKGL